MARPIKKGLDYFPVDVMFDDNIELLEAECGLEGLGILIKLWQKIYQNSYFIEWNEDVELLFSRKINSEVTTVNAVINACFRRNILYKPLYESHNILTSKAIQKRYTRICKDAKRSDSEINPDFIIVNSELIPNKPKLVPEFSTHSKVKKIREDNTIEINEFFERVWKLYPNKKGKGQVKPSKKKELHKLDDEIDRCVQRYIDYAKSLKYAYNYQNGSTFFNSGYIDYLDENYTEGSQGRKTIYD